MGKTVGHTEEVVKIPSKREMQEIRKLADVINFFLRNTPINKISWEREVPIFDEPGEKEPQKTVFTVVSAKYKPVKIKFKK